MTNVFGYAETYDTTRGDLSTKFILKNGDGDSLDLSASFFLSDVLIPEVRKVDQAAVPFRTVHPRASSYGLPTSASFELDCLSLRKTEIERQVAQIREFWDQSPGKVVDIYWIDADNADPYGIGDRSNYYAYLPECSLVQFRPLRAYGQKSAGSIIDLDVSSPYTKTIKEFPEDAAPAIRVFAGKRAVFALTGNGSPVITASRTSDGQGLLVFDDQGNLKIKGSIKTHQDLGTIEV